MSDCEELGSSTGGSGGSGAPTDAQYLTLAVNATLTNERVLTGTADQIILTDGGAGSTLTLSLPQAIATTSSPQFTGLTLTGVLSAQADADSTHIIGRGSINSALASDWACFSHFDQRASSSGFAVAQNASGQAIFNTVAGTSMLWRVGNSTRATMNNNQFLLTPAATTTGIFSGFGFTAAANTGLTASTEHTDIDFNLSATKTWATGAITLNRDVRLQGRTYAFVGASTVSDAISYDFTAPTAGTNATLTRRYGIRTDNFWFSGGLRVGVAGTATNATLTQANFYIGVTDTSAARTITLPPVATVAEGTVYIIKDESGNASVNNITVDGNGAETIDLAPNQTINTNNGRLSVIVRNGAWFIINN